ncbi:MAG: hypothetical protein Q8L49_16650 [Burkholderiaceae bacterium]|nr:hypothetical protein [Burkholderiaceae bacterium]
MVNPFRHWFGGSREGERWSTLAAWAAASGHRFARSRDGDGFVIAPTHAVIGWRLEWGPSQRHYFSGSELRLRAAIGATGDLQMLVITRELMALLEQQVFEESTDGTETRMDDDLPEEMRWLVLYPKLPRAELGVLRERFGALSNFPRAALSWLNGPLARQLDMSSVWRPADQALVLVVQRGRLTLRCPVPQPELPALQGALGLFGVALNAARRVGTEVVQGRIGGARPGTGGLPSAMPPAEEPLR